MFLIVEGHYHFRHHPETIKQKTTMQLTKEDALRAYARRMNTLDASHLEPLLADDFHYASQMVIPPPTQMRPTGEYP